MTLEERLIKLLRDKAPYESAMHSIKIEKELLINGGMLREIVSALRSKGHPIGSSTKRGYWWAKSAEELDETVVHLSGRVQKISRATRGLRKAQSKMMMGI